MPGPFLLTRLVTTLLHPLTPQDVLGLLDPVHSSRQLRGVVTSVTRATPGAATIAFRPGPGWRPFAVERGGVVSQGARALVG